jgi:Fe-S cluster biogenesis protein NfuA
MKEEVIKAIDSVRPYLQADDGDVQFIELSEDGIVKVKFTGACSVCPLSQMTLRAGIERSLLRQVPGIRRVEAIS